MGSPLALRSQVEWRAGELFGWLEWPGNTLFRPTIGLFADGRLWRTLPCAFQDLSNDHNVPTTRWRFGEPLSIDDDYLTGKEIALSCLELAHVLYQRDRPTDASRPPQDIDRVIAMARPLSELPSTSMFEEFLRLPHVDQVHILYLDILSRGPDPSGLQSSLQKLSDGGMTILDLRDQMLASHEFRAIRSPGLLQPIARWCIWEGLADVIPLLLPPPGEFPPAPPSAEMREAHLLRLVRGETAAENARDRWLAAHVEMAASLADRRPVPSPLVQPRQIRPLLGSMSTGSAGLRSDDGIRNQPLVSGVLAYGPFLRLAPGTHRLSVDIECAASCARSYVKLQIVADEIVFGQASWPLSGALRHLGEHVFTVPSDENALLRNLRFEARLELVGEANVRIASVRIEQVDEDEPDYPSVANWLPFQSLSPLASRLADDTVVSIEGSGGHIIYGPYARLLPGHYVFAIDCSGDGGPTIAIEIVDQAGTQLATAQIHLNSTVERTELPFTVPYADSAAAVLRGLEFRISRLETAGTVHVKATRVTRTGLVLPASDPVSSMIAEKSAGLGWKRFWQAARKR